MSEFGEFRFAILTIFFRVPSALVQPEQWMWYSIPFTVRLKVRILSSAVV
jgi:hypothetical protein